MTNKIISIFQNIKKSFTDSTKNKVRVKIIQSILLNIVKAVLIIGLCFIIIYPMLQQLSQAFRSPEDLTNVMVVWIPENFTFLNVKIAATVLKYKEALINNITVSALVTVCQVTAASITGYAFARLKPWLSGVFFGLVILTIIVPPQTISLPTFLYLVKTGMYGQPNALYLMSLLGMGIKSGLFIFIFRQFFRNIPKELDESAEIDGAGIIKTFWSIMLPNARGAMVTVGLFAFVWQWNDIYYTGLFLGTRNDFPMLTLRLSNVAEKIYDAMFYAGVLHLLPDSINGGKNEMYNAIIANTAAFLMMIPLIIMYLFVQKMFVESIERTGIVG